MEQDFDPSDYASSMPLDIRLSRAAEYAAYQLGQINRKRDDSLKQPSELHGVVQEVR